MGVIPLSNATLGLFELKLTNSSAAGEKVRHTLNATELPFGTVAEPLVRVIVRSSSGDVVAVAVCVGVAVCDGVAEAVAVGISSVAVLVGLGVAVPVSVDVAVGVAVGSTGSP